MPSNLKILIIPSWYPTKSNPISGSFFREQALLISDVFDVKVLLGYPFYLSMKRYLKLFLMEKFLHRKRIYNNANFNAFIMPPDVESFYYEQSHVLSSEINIKLMMKFYSDKVVELLKNNWKPDLLHAHCTVMGGIIAVKLGEIFNIPVVITEHSGPFLLHTYTTKQQLQIKFALEHATTVAVVSYHQMRSILMHNIQCDPLVIGNLIDEKLFPLKKKQKSKSDVFCILILGYPSYIKDMKTFFLALHYMTTKNFKNISATVIGVGIPGDLSKDDYYKYARDCGVDEYCTFIDYVERDGMWQYYHKSDVVLSVSIAETFGISMAESLACGVPVITTDSGGISDVVDPSNGIIVNIRDYVAIAQGLIKIYKGDIVYDPKDLRKSIVQKYGRQAFRKKLVNMYLDTIGQSIEI